MFGFWLIVRISASYPDFNVRILASCPIRSSTYLLLLVRLCYARLLVVVPSLSLVLWSVDLGVALSGNQRCSPWCWYSRLRVSSRLRAPGCDETIPQYVSSSCDRQDSEWGVLRFESRTIGSASDGRFGYWPKNQPIVICNHMASFVASC